MLKLKISEDLKTAMKQKEFEKLSVLRVLKSEIERNEQSTNGKVDLGDVDIVKLIKKLIEGINSTTKNEIEIKTLELYLPKQLSEDEIMKVVDQCISDNKNNLGEIMSFFKSTYDGQYNGKILSTIVREKLVK